MSVLVPPFWQPVFWLPKRFLQEEIDLRKARSEDVVFWRISMAFFFWGWKKTDRCSLDETGFRSLEGFGFVVGFLFPMCMRLMVKKESDERVAEDV